MRIKALAFVAGTISALAVLAAPVDAAPPVVVEDFEFDETFDVPAEEFPCGVDVSIREVVSVRVTVFFDQDGAVKRVREHVNGTTHVTSEYGETVDRWVQNNSFDPSTETVAITGNPWNVHAGAGGVLVNDSGRIVIDTTTGEALAVNGPHQAFFGEFDGACAVLAP